MDEGFRERVAEERAAQGLPVRAVDPVAVAAMAGLMSVGGGGFGVVDCVGEAEGSSACSRPVP